jgi:uncharacterized integral membrane protein
MNRLRFYSGLVIGCLLTLFALQNLQATPVRILIWHVEPPVVVIVLGSGFIGAVWAMLWMSIARWRHSRAASISPGPPDRTA